MLVVNKQRVRYIAEPTLSGIYFIQAQDKQGLIKIGWSVDCESRLRILRIGSPVELRIAAIVPGTRKRERQLHEQFNHLRVHGEWFRPSPELLDVIEFCRSLTRV